MRHDSLNDTSTVLVCVNKTLNDIIMGKRTLNDTSQRVYSKFTLYLTGLFIL
jgi:hypothetical protein